MAPAIPAERYAERLARARDAAGADGVSALLVGVGPELEWLTGYAAHGFERLNLLVISGDRPVAFVGPRIELEAARQAPGLSSDDVEHVTWSDGEDPYRLVAPLVDGQAQRRFLVSDGLRSAFLLGLQAALPDATWGLVSATLAPLRRVKDADEIALLEAAAAAADRTIERIVSGRLVGRTEAEVAREVRDTLVAEGHDTAEFAIVASGPNSASPHHEPGGRVIGAGEPLLFDIGGRLGGYCSDTTRTVWVAAADGSAPDETFLRIHALVAQGQAAGRDAVRPGATFESLDAAARDVIAAEGYGEAFFHRLGHGIGLEVHEEPYLLAGNRAAVVAGDAFSVEPGIYLEGRYGVRIEDVVVCTDEGGRSLNTTPRDLRIVSGR